jgi:phage shock protein PspC (stress-responsive transcriptional regulator)
MISGVASGLADYFDVDPTVVRLVFIIAALINGIGIFIYIVMSFIVPVRERVVPGEAAVGEENPDMNDTPTRQEAATPAAPSPAAEPESQWGHGHWQHREQRHTWAGLILIALGVLFLAQNMGLLLWWNWRIFWPAVLIGVGALLLTRQLRR